VVAPVSRFPLVLGIVLVIVAAAAGSAVLYYVQTVKPVAAPKTVALGDNVTVDYTGIFGSGPEQGRVFDTSVYSIATNDAYPKALTFHSRGSAQNFTPLDVFVGSNAPSSGYSLGGKSFIGVVTGFWQGLIGLTGNQTRTITVPPALGYGPDNPACEATAPLTYTLPVVRTMSGGEFATLYPGQLATTGAEFADPHYGWPVLIFSANATSVTIVNQPTVGEVSDPSGWSVLVTAVQPTANGTGTITLVNQLSPSDAGHVLGHDYAGTGPCSSQAHGQFIVSAVDPAAGTYTENFNQEVQGQTLIFQVKVIDIFPPGTGGL
jgi:FKBP-type peptidyl-prolyl cis-trans isomerase 2